MHLLGFYKQEWIRMGGLNQQPSKYDSGLSVHLLPILLRALRGYITHLGTSVISDCLISCKWVSFISCKLIAE